MVCHIYQLLKGLAATGYCTDCLVNIIDVYKLTSHTLAAQLIAAG